MALSRAKYKRVTDLYTPGIELELLGGDVMWLQAMNPFERDEAQRDAQLARSRLVLALRGQHASEERDRVVSQFLSDGREEAIKILAQTLANNKLVDIVNGLRDDPEWRERVQIIEREDAINGTLTEEIEKKQVADFTAEYLTEVQNRVDSYREDELKRLEHLDDAGLVEEYIEVYIDSRGGVVATAEYNLTEAWYAARVCEGVKGDDGNFDHSACESHRMRVFEEKQELREAPEILQNLIGEKLRELAMTARDARFLDKPASSSASSQPPSEAAASPASTPEATSDAAPGT